VLAFLRTEMDSPRFGTQVRRALSQFGGLDLVRDHDLTSERQNRRRENALTAARGWRTGTGLFRGFPDDVEWRHGVMTPDEISRVRFINYSYWVELSGGSRRPGDVLPTLRAGRLPAWLTDLGTSWCWELSDRLAADGVVDDLIVMATPDLRDLVVLEGHARLAAMFVGGLEHRITVRAYLGLSSRIDEWDLY
jgi:hypothetical protein